MCRLLIWGGFVLYSYQQISLLFQLIISTMLYSHTFSHMCIIFLLIRSALRYVRLNFPYQCDVFFCVHHTNHLIHLTRHGTLFTHSCTPHTSHIAPHTTTRHSFMSAWFKTIKAKTYTTIRQAWMNEGRHTDTSQSRRSPGVCFTYTIHTIIMRYTITVHTNTAVIPTRPPNGPHTKLASLDRYAL